MKTLLTSLIILIWLTSCSAGASKQTQPSNLHYFTNADTEVLANREGEALATMISWRFDPREDIIDGVTQVLNNDDLMNKYAVYSYNACILARHTKDSCLQFGRSAVQELRDFKNEYN